MKKKVKDYIKLFIINIYVCFKKNRKRITVEIDNLNQLKKIMDLKFDAILFDNMSIKNLRKGLWKKMQTFYFIP